MRHLKKLPCALLVCTLGFLACSPVDISTETDRRTQTQLAALDGGPWYGTITATYTQQRDDKYSSEQSTTRGTWNETTYATLTVHLLGDHATMDWLWDFKQNDYKQFEDSNCTVTDNQFISEYGQGNVSAELYFGIDPDQGRYSFSISPGYEEMSVDRLTTSDRHGCKYSSIPAIVSGSSPRYTTAYVFDQPWTPEQSSFSGSVTTSTYELGAGHETEVINWSISRTPDIELVVKPRDYAQWRPRGSRPPATPTTPATPGDILWVEAVVQHMDGSPSEVPAKWIQFELADVSQVPGIAMNYPRTTRVGTGTQAEPYDLDFNRTFNPHLEISGQNNQIARTPDGQHLNEWAGVASYDWGAYGEIRVTAELIDGRKLTGHLLGWPKGSILIPQRSPDSFIADSWKRSEGGFGLSDEDDREIDPEPDQEGHMGDGLTLYEEYRGFIESSGQEPKDESRPLNWSSGNPRKKDLFVVNKVGQALLPGMALFARLSGLDVHYYLDKLNITTDRIINFNKHPKPSLHATNQHAIVVNTTPKMGSVANTIPRPGLPRDVDLIEFPVNFFTPPETTPPQFRLTPQERDVAVAHELAHACTVRHHGENDDFRLWKVNLLNQVEESPKSSGNVPAPVQIVRPLRESDQAPISSSRLILPKWIWVTEWNGRSSGDEKCIMRYYRQGASVYRAQPDGRLIFDQEPIGSLLCTGKDGNDFNAPQHQPQSRHGSATLGDCLHQICVNDNTQVTHPSR